VLVLPAVSSFTFAMPNSRATRLRSIWMFWTRSMGMLRFFRLNTPLWMTICFGVMR